MVTCAELIDKLIWGKVIDEHKREKKKVNMLKNYCKYSVKCRDFDTRLCESCAFNTEAKLTYWKSKRK